MDEQSWGVDKRESDCLDPEGSRQWCKVLLEESNLWCTTGVSMDLVPFNHFIYDLVHSV